jgi:hypothetical protein
MGCTLYWGLEISMDDAAFMAASDFVEPFVDGCCATSGFARRPLGSRSTGRPGRPCFYAA